MAQAAASAAAAAPHTPPVTTHSQKPKLPTLS
ncbi:unnamed protein product, partial [Allacma fusca]